jgi:hypothetical protein
MKVKITNTGLEISYKEDIESRAEQTGPPEHSRR